MTARRIHDRNATQVRMDSANSANDANSAGRTDKAASTVKAAPIAATPAALAICWVVPYMPEPEPALAGFTVDRTTPDKGAITKPWPQPKITNSSASTDP